MRRLIVVAVLFAVACSGGGGGGGSPTTPTPPPSTWTLSGTVSETVPTASTRIAGAIVLFVDGSNAGRSATSDSNGAYQIASLQPGGFTVRVTAAGYAERSFPVTLVSNQTQNFELDPAFQMLTTTRNESISGGDACSGPGSTDPCKQYTLNVHHSGVIDGVLTWTDRDTWLWLELYRTSDGQQLARASQSRVDGLRQQVNINASGRTQYLIRVRWLFGARITPFSLVVSRPS